MPNLLQNRISAHLTSAELFNNLFNGQPYCRKVNMDPLLAKYAPEFTFLVTEMGFKIKSSEEFKQTFGDVIIILAGPKIEFQITRDRGLMDIEVRRLWFGGWHYLDDLLVFLGAFQKNPNDLTPPMDKLSDALRSNCSEFLSVFNNRSKYSDFLKFDALEKE